MSKKINPITGEEIGTPANKDGGGSVYNPITQKNMQGYPSMDPFTGSSFSDVTVLNIPEEDKQRFIEKGVPMYKSFKNDLYNIEAERQSTADKVANGLVRLVGTTGTKLLEGLGFIGGYVPYMLTGDINYVTDNFWVNGFASLEEGIKESFPIYKTKEYEKGNILDKMSSLSWWTDDFVDGAAFMASALVPGSVLSKMGAGYKVTNTYSKIGRQMSSALNKTKLGRNPGATKGLKTLSQEGDLAAITAWNTINEAGFEAKDTQESIRTALLKERELGKNSLSDEEINLKASKGARNTFISNVAFVMPSNYITSSFVFKSLRDSKRAASTILQKADNGLIEPLSKRENITNFLKGAGMSSASEGLYEENIQLSISNYQKNAALGKADGGWIKNYIAGMVENLTTDEGQEAIVLGSLLGLIPGGIKTYKEKKGYNDRVIKIRDLFENSVSNYQERITDFYERDKNGEIVLDENNNPVLDENKLKDTILSASSKKINFDRKTAAALYGDSFMFNYIKDIEFASMSYPFISELGGMERLEEEIDIMAEQELNDTLRLSDIDLNGNKIDVNYIKDNLKNRLKELQRIYNKVNQDLGGLQELNPTIDSRFVNILKVSQFSELVKQSYIEGVIDELQIKKDILDTKLKDNNSKIEEINSAVREYQSKEIAYNKVRYSDSIITAHKQALNAKLKSAKRRVIHLKEKHKENLEKDGHIVKPSSLSPIGGGNVTPSSIEREELQNTIEELKSVLEESYIVFNDLKNNSIKELEKSFELFNNDLNKSNKKNIKSDINSTAKDVTSDTVENNSIFEEMPLKSNQDDDNDSNSINGYNISDFTFDKVDVSSYSDDPFLAYVNSVNEINKLVEFVELFDPKNGNKPGYQPNKTLMQFTINKIIEIRDKDKKESTEKPTNDVENKDVDFVEVENIELSNSLVKEEFIIDDEGLVLNDIEETNTSFNKIAFLSRNYEEKREVNSDGTVTFTKKEIDDLINYDNYDANINDPVEYTKGTIISFEIDYNYNQNNETYESLLEKESKLNATNELIPIIIKSDDKIIGYVHTVEWIRKNSNSDTLAFNLQKIKELRNVIANSESILQGTITYKGTGRLLKNKDNKIKLLKDVFTDPNLQFSIAKDLVPYINDNDVFDKIVINNQVLSDGQLYVIAPVKLNNNNELENLLLPIRRNNITEKEINSIIDALKIYLNNKINEVAETLDNDFNINLLNISGLRSFISQYIHIENVDKTLNTKDYFNSLSSNYSAIIITGNSIDFGKGKGIGYRSISRNTPKEQLNSFLQDFRKFLSESKFRADISKINKSNIYNVFYISENKVISSSYNNYNIYLKSVTSTNLFSVELPNGNFTYTIQPIVKFNLETNSKKEDSKETDSKKEDSKGNKDNKNNTVRVPKGVNFDLNSFGNVKNLPLFNINKYESLKTKITKNYLGEGLSLYKQDQIVKSIAYNVNQRVIEEGSVKFKDVMVEWVEFFKDIKHIYDNNKDEKGQKEIGLILDNWSLIQNLVKDYTLKIQDLDTFNLENESDSQVIRDTYSDNFFFRLNPKNVVGTKIKRLIAFIPKVDKDNNIIRSYIGTEYPVEFEEVFSTLKSLLSNVPADFEVMMDTLKSHYLQKPYLLRLIDSLNSAETQVQNEFVSAISSHKANMKMVYISETKDSYTATITDSNLNAIDKIITNNWLNNFKNSDIVLIEDQEIKLNKESTVKLISEFDSWEELPTNNQIINWLGNLGINIEFNTVENLRKTGLKRGNTVIKFESLFRSKKGLFRQIRNYLDFNIDQIIEPSKLIKSNDVSSLAKIDSKYKEGIYPDSFRDTNGNKIYFYTLNNLFVDRVRNLKTSTSLLSNLRKSVFSKNSTWLSELSKENGNLENSIFRNIFNYFYLDGLKINGNRHGKKVENTDFRENEIFRLSLFTNSGKYITDNGVKRRISNVVFPTNSDKSRSVGLTILSYNVRFNLRDTLHKDTLKDIYNLIVVPEIDKILYYQKHGIPNIEGFNKRGLKFNLFHSLNNKQELFKDGKLIEDIKENKEALTAIYSEIINVVNNLVESKLNEWQDLNITEETIDNRYIQKFVKVTNSKNKLKFIAADYVINSLISNMNIYQLFIGDPSAFGKNTIKDTFDNVGKRLASDIAPGLSLNSKESYNQLIVEDVNVSSLLTDYYKEIGITNFESYNSINSTDAQEFVTVKEKLRVLYLLGRVTKEQVVNINNRLENNNLSEEDVAIILQPEKPVYTDTVFDYNANALYRLYIKSAAYPLIPSVTKGLEIDKIRQMMEKNNVDRLVFKSGVKSGAKNKEIEITDDQGNIVVPSKEIIKSNILQLNRTNFRIQQDVPYKGNKKEVTDGSQQSILLFSNIKDKEFSVNNKDTTGEQLYENYNNLYKEIFDIQLEEFYKEFDIDKSNPEINIVKLSSILQDEAIKRDYPISSIEGLQLNEEGNFIIPIQFNSNSNRIESIILSIIDNRVRKVLMTGNSFVQSSGVFYKSLDDKSINKSDIVFTKRFQPNKGLQGARVENGEFKPAQILIPNRFKDNQGNNIDIYDYLDEKGYLDLNKIPEKILNVFQYRIPTQGHNSMSLAEIVGFLPEKHGDLIIVPNEYVNQMGSDFDLDVLYTYFFNTIKDEITGNLVIIDDELFNNKEDKVEEFIKRKKELQVELQSKREEKNKDLIEISDLLLSISKIDKNINLYKSISKKDLLKNEILDIHFTVLTSKEVHVQNYSPLDLGLFKDSEGIGIAKSIYDKIDNKPVYTYLSDSYYRDKYVSGMNSKAAIGVKSLDSIFNIILQYSKKSIFPVYYKEENEQYIAEEYSIRFGNLVSNALSEPKTNKGRYKSEVISAYQSASLDNEKEQILEKINSNKYTFDVERILVQMGFEEDIISIFMSQDVIRDYVQFRNNGDSKYSAYSRAEQKYFVDKSFTVDFNDLGFDTMFDMINNPKYKNYTENQYVLFQRFKKLSTYGEELAKIQKLVNNHSSGVPNNLLSVNKTIKQISELQENSMFYNIENIIGNYINVDSIEDILEYVQKSNKEKEQYFSTGLSNIKPTHLSSISFFSSTYQAAKLYNKYFNYDSTNVKFVLKEISKNFENPLNDETINNIQNSFKSFTYANNNFPLYDNVIQERYRLFIDSDSNSSLASVISTIKDKTNIDNYFLNRLTLNIDKLNGSTIFYNSDGIDSYNKTLLYLSFAELLTSNKVVGNYYNREYKEMDLAEDLIKYFFLSGGNNNFVSFGSLIPLEYLKESGVVNYINSIDYNDPSTLGIDKYKFLENTTSLFTEQYIRHNVDKLTKIKESDNEFISKKENEIILHNSTYTYVRHKNELYKFINENGNNEFIKDTNETGYRYLKISKLGNKSINEYNSSSVSHDSVYNKNGKYTSNIDNLWEVFKSDVIQSDYKFYSNKSYTPNEILESITKNTRDKFNKWYANELLKKLENVSIHSIPAGREFAGRVVNNWVMFLNSQAIADRDFERVILHEFTHILTGYKLATDTKFESKIRTLIDITKRRMSEDNKKEYDKIIRGKYSSKSDLLYGLTNEDEFLSEIASNQEFRKLLSAVKYDKKSIWERFKDLLSKIITDFLGLKNEDTVLREGLSELLDTITNYDMSVFSETVELEKYLGLRNKEGVYKVFTKKDNILNKVDEVINNIDHNIYQINFIDFNQIAPNTNNNDKIITLSRQEFNTPLREREDRKQKQLNELRTNDLPLFTDQTVFNSDNKQRDNKILLSNRKSIISVLNKAKAKYNTLENLTEVSYIESLLNKISSNLGTIIELNDLESIALIGEEDLDLASNLINSGRPSPYKLFVASKIVNLWKKGIDLLFTEDEKTSVYLKDLFRRLENRANNIENDIYEQEKSLMEIYINKYNSKGNVNINSVFETKDISSIHAETLDISRVNNPMFQAILSSYKNANNFIGLEAEEKTKELKDIIYKATKSVGSKNKLYAMFKQKYNDGKATGELIRKYSPEYEDKKDALYYITFLKNISPTKKDLLNYYKWKRENEIVFNYKRLFENNDEKDLERYKNLLITHIGKLGFEELYKVAKLRYEKYKQDYEVAKERIDIDYEVGSTEHKNEMIKWKYTYDPEVYANNIINGKIQTYKDTIILFRGNQYILEIPKRYIKNKETQWYDKNFLAIENNQSVYNMYSYILSLLKDIKSYLPEGEKRDMRVNTLPKIKKSIIDKYKDKGSKYALTSIYEKFIKSIVSDDLDNISYSYRDPITGEVEKSLPVNFLESNNREVTERLNIYKAEYLIKNGNKPSRDDIKFMRRKILDEIAQENSFDLENVLKAYTVMGLTYKHKSIIEDYVKLGQSILNSAKEYEFNANNQIKYDTEGKKIRKVESKSFTNLKKQYENFFNTFYGHAKDLEGVSNVRKLTKSEKQEKKKLEDLLKLNESEYELGNLSEIEYNNNKANITKKIETLGGNITTSKVGDQILKWVQLKGMGWNIYSGISNMGFGFISNMIEAADGRSFTMKEYMQGLYLTKSSMLKNYTFNSVESSTAKKIRHLMDKYDVLKDASQEYFYNNNDNLLLKNIRWMSPYQIQKRTEYFNQAPVMVAMMLHQKVKLDNGEEISLWDAYDNDGNIKEGVSEEWNHSIGDSKRARFKNKIDQIIKSIHGNYDPHSPINIKRKLITRALAQFRTWMLEGFANRFEKEKYDDLLGYVRKGRYRTYGTYFSQQGGINGTIFLLKQLIRKLAFQSTKFDSKLNEVDAANMRKNLTELVIYMNIVIMGLMLLMLDDDEDDKAKKRKRMFAVNYTINQLLRLQTDIEFYIHPASFEALTKNSIPAMGLITDIGQWINAGGKLIIGEDEIDGGPYDGESRIIRETTQLLPFGTQLYRNRSAATQIFKK